MPTTNARVVKIPRADGKTPTILSSTKTLPDTATPGFFARIKGRLTASPVQEQIMDLIPIELRKLHMGSDFSNGVRQAKDPESLRHLLDLTKLLFSDSRFESDLEDLALLASCDSSTVRDVRALSGTITPGQGSIGRIIHTREMLLRNFDYSSDDKDFTTAIAAHAEMSETIERGDERGDFPTYWETPDLVDIVRRHPEATERIVEYMKTRKTTILDRDGNSVSGFEPDVLEELLDIPRALDDGFL